MTRCRAAILAGILLLVLPGAPASARTRKKPKQGGAEAANAAPVRAVSLAELLEVASRQSPGLQKAKFSREAAEGAALAAEGVDDWVLNAAGEYRSSQNPIVVGQPVQTTKTESLRLTTGLTVPLPTGGRIGADLELAREHNNYLVAFDNSGGGPSTFQVQQFTALPALRLQHPLLRGAGRVARAERNAARFQETAEAARARAGAIQTVYEIIDGYWTLAHAILVLDIKKRSVQLAESQMRIAEISIRAGKSPASTARAVGHRLAVREHALLVAEVDVTEKALALRRLVGLELGPGEIDLQIKDVLKPVGRTYPLDPTLETVLAKSPDLVAAQEILKARGVERKAANDQMLPQLDVSARVGPRGISDSLAGAANQAGGFENMDIQAGVNLTYEFPLRAARGASGQAEAQERQAKLDVEEMKRQLVVETVRAVDRVRAAGKQVEVASRAVELARANMEDEEARFRAGRTTIFEVLNRQDELGEAQAQLADSLLAEQRANARVESLTGAILDRAGLEMPVK